MKENVFACLVRYSIVGVVARFAEVGDVELNFQLVANCEKLSLLQCLCLGGIGIGRFAFGR